MKLDIDGEESQTPRRGALKPTSVVLGIATRNRAKALLNALRSARSQSLQISRIHVFDDCSTDETCQLRLSEADVTWDFSARPLGIIAARNHMMLAASENYFVSLDDDAWFLDGDELDIAVRYLNDNQKVGAVAFDILTPDASERKPRGEARSVAIFVGCAHVVRVELVKRIGGYKAYPGYYGGEEQDLCLKLLDLDCSIALLPGVHVWHDKTMVGRDLKAQHRSGVCNDLCRTFVRYPGALVAPTLLWKLLMHLRFAIANGLFRPAINGVGDFLRSLPGLSDLRDPVGYRAVALARRLRDVRAPLSLERWKRHDQSQLAAERPNETRKTETSA
jgi:GT2 family glycosyltransferase